ncbi:malonic semialdehyde reductase [Pandoraea bronchicola]|uniref:Putative NADH dehydrogenase/NAD(P)H nitroreductase PBR20603_03149 n=1 Tax=Pandoraea bronchicola TaxID=2508287 RepID=A0A5E5BXY1_9BURK|nr:malonic semialdehyde reductase [Pandoraea bronchicola]VVE89183.1 malonic semialdehyde reductase [Pandoraea bronchicola]
MTQVFSRGVAWLDAVRGTLPDAALDQLFRTARSHNVWRDVPVADATLHALYALMKWAPTSANGSPARLIFVRTPAGRARLLPLLSPGNVEKTRTAPVTVIIAHDLDFHTRLGQLFPHNPGAAAMFADDAELAAMTAFRNGSLQGAYLIMAARAVGLDCGPMSGFDAGAIEREFLSTDSLRQWGGQMKVNFLCNLGYGDETKCFARSPRLRFDEACRLE